LFVLMAKPLLGAAGGGLSLAPAGRRRSRRAPEAPPAVAAPAIATVSAATGLTDEVLDPAVGTGHRAPVAFNGPPARGVDRCRVGSRLVPLRSEPGELLGVLVGRLDVGDEVDVLRQEGTNCYVRTPSGAEGWVPGMALLSAPVTPVPTPPGASPAAEPTAVADAPATRRARKGSKNPVSPEPRPRNAHGGAA